MAHAEMHVKVANILAWVDAKMHVMDANTHVKVHARMHVRDVNIHIVEVINEQKDNYSYFLTKYLYNQLYGFKRDYT